MQQERSKDSLKTLIHLHTNYSYDSDIAIETLARFADDEGIDCIAVTDHDTIEGALHLRRVANCRVIIGEEVTTRDGHLIGLFITEHVRSGLSARETALRIKGQGGLVLVPHPFTRAFGCGLGSTIFDIMDLIDAVEINNAQHLLPIPDTHARRFARKHNIVSYVGADSHKETSIAPCYQMMPLFTGRDDFIAALSRAELFPGRHPLAYFAEMGYQLARYLLLKQLAPHVGANAKVNGLGEASLS